MVANKLKLNEDKTEVIKFEGGSRGNRSTFEEIRVCGSVLKICKRSVRNLGVHFDSELNMKTHITKVIQSCNFYLKSISKIRSLLDFNTCKMMIVSYVLSRIDYCNSLLAGCNKADINRLQKLQNKAARLVTLTRNTEHITPILMELHWLPVCERINFKINVTTYKSLNDMSPEYLQELISLYQPTRVLRSSDALLINDKLCKTKFSL